MHKNANDYQKTPLGFPRVKAGTTIPHSIPEDYDYIPDSKVMDPNQLKPKRIFHAIFWPWSTMWTNLLGLTCLRTAIKCHLGFMESNTESMFLFDSRIQSDIGWRLQWKRIPINQSQESFFPDWLIDNFLGVKLPCRLQVILNWNLTFKENIMEVEGNHTGSYYTHTVGPWTPKYWPLCLMYQVDSKTQGPYTAINARFKYLLSSH